MYLLIVTLTAVSVLSVQGTAGANRTKGADDLVCRVCDSKESWQDCKAREGESLCPTIADVCMTYKVLGRDNFKRFTKRCGRAETCNGKEIRDQGYWAEVYCCNHNSCNDDTPGLSSSASGLNRISTPKLGVGSLIVLALFRTV